MIYYTSNLIEQSCFGNMQTSVLFLIEYIATNLKDSSTNQYGCCLVQCAIANDACNKHLIFNELLKYLPQLCNDDHEFNMVIIQYKNALQIYFLL